MTTGNIRVRGREIERKNHHRPAGMSSMVESRGESDQEGGKDKEHRG